MKGIIEKSIENRKEESVNSVKLCRAFLENIEFEKRKETPLSISIQE